MKPTSSYRLGFLAAAAASALVPHAHLYAQSATTAGISGVVSSLAGPSFARASVTARHEPTGTVYTAVSRGDGQFDFRGLIPGGPYTITATVEGAAPIVLSGHYAPLGEVSTVTLVPGGDVQTLEEM